jgi:sulfonate transport system substrate-binding protein
MSRTRILSLAAIATAIGVALTGCVPGEGSNLGSEPEPTAEATLPGSWSSDVLNLDFATYNPLSLIIKDQGWLEDTFDGKVTVNWLQSAGSAAANEALKAGSIDVGSTAGSAALLARSNGSPIQTIDIYSQPNWAAILVGPNSDITTVADLKGKNIAANAGTDPYFFLLQALDEAGIGLDEVTITQLQHADGKTALEAGTVDAWAGLDPLLSASVVTAGSKIIYDNPDFNSYGFLNATEAFLAKSPDIAQVVVDAYEKAREWAIANPDEAAAILAEVAGIDLAIAESVLIDRTALDIDPVPGDTQRAVLEIIGPVFVSAGTVATQDAVDDALDTLFNTEFIDNANPALIG